jgi:SAM-dependent methyltransferase
MHSSVALQLRHLNQTFYDRFAADFADSRRKLQRGIERALRAVGPFDSLIDIGCGDGRLGRALATGLLDHPVTRYLGVDFSARLLEQWKRGETPLPDGYALRLSDFSATAWAAHITPPFDVAACFAALHHIPGHPARLRLLRDMRSMLNPGGRCILSVWQFLHLKRFKRKIVDWAEIGLSADAVDRGDYLLDWQRGGSGLRYVHHFSESELIDLCQQAGFIIHETYRSDGKTNDLGLYVLLETGS